MTMRKVNVALVIGGLFISGVLVFLMIDGVRLKERQIVKWSNVATPTEAGRKMGRFLYPLIKQKNKIFISGQGDFSQAFFQGFAAEAKKNWSQAEVYRQNKNQSGFVIKMISLDAGDFKELCKKGEPSACLAQKSLKKFNSKNRSQGVYWINMFRLSEESAALFYIKI